MEEITKTVKAFTLELGADMVGIGSADTMNMEARKLQTPEENLPGAKAVNIAPVGVVPLGTRW